MARAGLMRAIRHAEADDLVGRMHAYVVLCLVVGVRTEEARALRWDDVVTWVDDVAGWQPVTEVGFDGARAGEDRFAINVWRSDRYGGEGTASPRPRRRCTGTSFGRS
jgi:integrase